MDSFDSYYFACGSKHKEQAARFASVVCVHSCVRFLIALILKMFVLAVDHRYRPGSEDILAFGDFSGLGIIRA